MKKLVFLCVAIAAISLASCGNKAKDDAAKQADSIRKADSIAAIEAQQAAQQAADSTSTDSTAAPADSAKQKAN